MLVRLAYEDEFVMFYEGDWRAVALLYERFDTTITDPPYSKITHRGHNAGAAERRDICRRQSIEYDHLEGSRVPALVADLDTFTDGWIFVMTDDELAPHFKLGARALDRYAFAPVPIIQRRPRLSGDGPASWAVYGMASRPRRLEYSRWRCLPGAYESETESIPGIVGVKPVALMAQIIRDYSRQGDVIFDPFAGSASTLIAARAMGRRAIGCEISHQTCEIAVARLKGQRVRLAEDDPRQVALF